MSVKLTKEELTKILEHLDYEDKMCSVCKYENDCYQGVRYYGWCGDESNFPPCYNRNFINIVDFEKLEKLR